MEIPNDSQNLITRSRTTRLGALTFQPGYKWILEQTSFLHSKVPFQQRVWHIENNKFEPLLCPICTKKILNWSRHTNTYKKVCSLQCATKDENSKQKRKQTCLEKYGVENPSRANESKERQQKTHIEKYGCHPRQTKEVQDKYKQTNVKRYGVEYPIRNTDIQNKIKQTCLERYGTNNPLENIIIQDKIKATVLEKYGVPNFKQAHINQIILDRLNDPNWLYQEHVENKRTLWNISKELGIRDGTVGRYLHDHGYETKIHSGSQAERELQQFLTEYDIKFESNVRNIIKPLELDIYIPENKLAIEYCGLYWHSSKFKSGMMYHREKLQACNKLGIRLITIFEDEWLYKQELVKQKILSILDRDPREKVFARKCKIVTVHKQVKTEFFNKYHIQEDGPGSINIGLEHNNELVACMTFIKQPNKVMNLNRYATSKQVVGGFSKLLSHFKKNYEWNEILSFADLRWSEGNMYNKNEFKLHKTLPPDYEYVDLTNMTRIHKFNFRHINLRNILGDMYDPNLSETQNTLRAGWYKIYNCGLLRYTMENEHQNKPSPN
ncbi:MAG: DUF7487 domain-containing protein [Nitrososphaeraceae archaeon]